jgi:hypothetical protein
VNVLWQLPHDTELVLVIVYIAGVLIGARLIEAMAKAHFTRVNRIAEQGFEYIELHGHYHCRGGATLRLDAIHDAGRMAIYRAPVEHCGGCRLKPSCAPGEDSRRIYRSLATWAETDVGRFHQFVSIVMFSVACVLAAAGLWHWRGQPGVGYLALGLVGGVACLLLQSHRMKTVLKLPTAKPSLVMKEAQPN